MWDYPASPAVGQTYQGYTWDGEKWVSGGASPVSDGDKGDVVVSGAGTTWLFDPGVVTAAARTVLDDATIAAMGTTLGLDLKAAKGVNTDITSMTALTAVTGPVAFENALQFPTTLGQKINLFDIAYGFGIQTSALYARTGGEFSVFLGGSHSPATGDPGAGGEVLLRVTPTETTIQTLSVADGSVFGSLAANGLTLWAKAPADTPLGGHIGLRSPSFAGNPGGIDIYVGSTADNFGPAVVVNGATKLAVFSAGIQVNSGGISATGTVQTVGQILARAVDASGPALFTMADSAASSVGYCYWAPGDQIVRLVQIASATEVAIMPTGRVIAGKAIVCRQGLGGANGANCYNFNWSPSATIEAWIDATNVGNVTLTCDYRTKKDVAPLRSTWDAVRALRPISFTRRMWDPPKREVRPDPEAVARLAAMDPGYVAPETLPQPDRAPLFADDDTPRWGFVAHELQDTLLPSAATGTRDADDVVQSPDLLAILAAVTRTTQELQDRVVFLEGQVAALAPRPAARKAR